MSRTVVGYIKQFLNTSASSSPYQSVEALTGLPIATGINVTAFQEFSDVEAGAYSSKGVSGVQILTAGSGQTPGTYTATASTGGAVIQYVVASGGTITAIPTVIVPGKYSVDTAPTFTLAANGGTAGTVAVSLGFLYSGTYAWAQLDPAVVTPVPVGTPLFWMAGPAGSIVTPTSSTTTNFPDFAGVSIDPGFGALNSQGQINNFAFVQYNGVAKILTSGGFTLGQPVGVVAATTSFTTAGATNAATTVGYSLAAITTLNVGLARIIRPVTEF